jgi:hypothetical protein
MNSGEYGAPLGADPNRKDIALEQKQCERTTVSYQILKTCHRRIQGTY